MSTASAPTYLACSVSSIASAVELEPAPAITGTRFFVVSTQISTTRLCSSCESVGLSPVVPTATRPCVPWAICHSTKRAKALSSTAPFRKGVISAVKDPLNMTSSSSLRHVVHRGMTSHRGPNRLLRWLTVVPSIACWTRSQVLHSGLPLYRAQNIRRLDQASQGKGDSARNRL